MSTPPIQFYQGEALRQETARLTFMKSSLSAVANERLQNVFTGVVFCQHSYSTGVATQSETKSHISLLCYRKEPHHTPGHTRTSPHLFLTHTHTFAQLDLLQISHTNLIMTEKKGTGCYACYLVGLLVIT